MESVILDICSENVTLGVEFRGDIYHQDRMRGKVESKRAGRAVSNRTQPGEIGTLRMGRKQGMLFLGRVIFCHILASHL